MTTTNTTDFTNYSTLICISADVVRATGLTVDAVRASIAEVECPADVFTENNWEGKPAIMIGMSTDADEIGDAATAELLDCVTRAGIRHSVSYDIDVARP